MGAPGGRVHDRRPALPPSVSGTGRNRTRRERNVPERGVEAEVVDALEHAREHERHARPARTAAPASNGASGRVTCSAVFVYAAAVRSLGSTSATTYAWRAGTSAGRERASSSPIATGRFGAKATAISSRFEADAEHHRPQQADSSRKPDRELKDAAWRIPIAKKTTASVPARRHTSARTGRRMKVWGTNPTCEAVEREPGRQAEDDAAGAMERRLRSAPSPEAARSRAKDGSSRPDRRPRRADRRAGRAETRRRGQAVRRAIRRASRSCCTCRRAGGVAFSAACGSIACSSEVNGPDSTTSVDTVPLERGEDQRGSHPVSANTVPRRPPSR